MPFQTQAYADARKEACLPKGFVYLEDIDPSIDQKIEFFTNENILGVPADGYKSGRAICTKMQHSLYLKRKRT